LKDDKGVVMAKKGLIKTIGSKPEKEFTSSGIEGEKQEGNKNG